ncbi:MAG: hypothetical protein WCQ53_01550 [bacterium]
MKDTFTVIQVCRDLSEAEVIKSKLMSHGIDSWLDSKHMVTMNWFYSNMIGGIKVRVNSKDEKKALEILKPVKTRTTKIKRSKKKILVAWLVLVPMAAALLYAIGMGVIMICNKGGN